MTNQMDICIKSVVNSYVCNDDRAFIDLYQSHTPNTPDVKQQAATDLQNLVSNIGFHLPIQFSQDFTKAHWGTLNYPNPDRKKDAVGMVSLVIPLAIDTPHDPKNTLEQKIIFKATVDENGELTWNVTSDFTSTGQYKYIENLLDSAAQAVDWNYFGILIDGARLDYALLVPKIWGNGAQDSAGANPIEFWHSAELSYSAETARTWAHSILNLLTQALVLNKTDTNDEGQMLYVAQVASILPSFPIESDPWVHGTLWQHFSYGEIIYLQQIFKRAMADLNLNPQRALGRLFQRNIDLLGEVHRYMRFDDDYFDDDLDPELHSNALNYAKKQGGPLPPDYAPNYKERINDYVAEQLIDVTGRVIDKSIPKIEAAIARLKPQLEKAIGDATNYLKDPKNTEELRKSLDDTLAALKPVMEKHADKMLKSLTAKLKEELPRIKILLDQLAKDLEQDTYPNHIKPVIADLVAMIDQLLKGSGKTPPVQENPNSAPSAGPALPGAPANVPGWKKK